MYSCSARFFQEHAWRPFISLTQKQPAKNRIFVKVREGPREDFGVGAVFYRIRFIAYLNC